MARLVAVFAALLLVLNATAIIPAHGGRPLELSSSVQLISIPAETVADPPSSSKTVSGLHRHFDIKMIEQPADGPAATYYYGVDCDYKVPVTGM